MTTLEASGYLTQLSIAKLTIQNLSDFCNEK